MRNIFKDRNWPLTGNIDFHLRNEDGYAVDYGCPENTPLYAPVSGELSIVSNWWAGDQAFLIKEKNGNYCFVAHNNKVVKTGWVNEGDLIGYSGNKGNSTGAHIHITFGYQNELQHILGWGTSKNPDILNFWLKNCANKIENSQTNNSTNNVKTPKRNSLLVKFTGKIPLFNKDKKQIGNTDNGWICRIYKQSNDWYVVESSNNLFYAKSGDINGNFCWGVNNTNRNVVRCRTTGNLPILNKDLKKINETKSNWYFWTFRSEFKENYYVVVFDNGDVNFIHKNYINGSRVFEA